MVESAAVYIGKLIFENYKSFKGRSELSLTDGNGKLCQWTVFLGNNNTGKTNLLKAIANLEAIPFYDNDDQTIEKQGRYTTLSSNNKYTTNNAKNFFRVFAEIYTNQKIASNKDDIATFDIEKITSNSLPENEPFWYYGGNLWKVEKIDLLENLKIYGYGVTRRIGNAGISEKRDDLNAASLFDAEYRLTNIEEWLFQLDYASKNGQPAADKRLKLLKKIIKSEILPEIIDIKFTTDRNLKNYIEYQTKDGWFLFEELGYGYQTTISWIIDLCKKMFERYPESANPLQEPAIVLVDELDLHLHPRWQKTIVDFLTTTFVATQFIVTTHSPLILQTLENVNLFALIKMDDFVKIQHIPFPSLEGWSVEEILSEIMEMEDGVFSDKHNKLFKAFDVALDAENYETARMAYDRLTQILHPYSAERKILKLQLSQIAANI